MNSFLAQNFILLTFKCIRIYQITVFCRVFGLPAHALRGCLSFTSKMYICMFSTKQPLLRTAPSSWWHVPWPMRSKVQKYSLQHVAQCSLGISKALLDLSGGRCYLCITREVTSEKQGSEDRTWGTWIVGVEGEGQLEVRLEMTVETIISSMMRHLGVSTQGMGSHCRLINGKITHSVVK